MPADLYGRDVKRRKQNDPTSSSISSSSFLSLKAELAKHQSSSSSSSSPPAGDDADARTSSSSRPHQRDEYSLPSSSSSKRRGEADESSLLSGPFSKPSRKLPAHLRPSPGTALRAAKDTSPSSSSFSSSLSAAKKSKKAEGGTYTLSAWSSTPSAQLERDRNLVLERKARLYDQLKRGLSGGVDEEDLRDEGRLGGLVDWERKVEEGGSGSESESDEGSGEGEGGGQDEEMVEFQDELGRTRRLRRSQVPMAQLIEMKRCEEEAEAANIPLLHGPQQHFPVLTTTSSASRHLNEDAPPPEQHFDASAEVRNRGAGFYRFTAGNEEERRRQMAGLREERERTLRERERRERGGDAQGEGVGEGLVPAGSIAPAPSLGVDSIKLTKGERRLAERRELIEARRRELAAAKQKSGGQEEEATDSVALQAEADGAKPTAGHDESGTGTEEERRERERQQRAIDHFLDEVDEEYRSRQT